jgi:succinyl-CoA synthetase beta subunit
VLAPQDPGSIGVYVVLTGRIHAASRVARGIRIAVPALGFAYTPAVSVRVGGDEPAVGTGVVAVQRSRKGNVSQSGT